MTPTDPFAPFSINSTDAGNTGYDTMPPEHRTDWEPVITTPSLLPNTYYQLWDTTQKPQADTWNGPLAFLGYADNKYRQVNEPVFLFNGVNYLLTDMRVSLNDIYNMIKEHGKRLAVKSCAAFIDRYFTLTCAILETDQVLDPWDWFYPIRNSNKAVD